MCLFIWPVCFSTSHLWSSVNSVGLKQTAGSNSSLMRTKFEYHRWNSSFFVSSCPTVTLQRPPVVSTEKPGRCGVSGLRCGGILASGLTAAGRCTWCLSLCAWCRTAEGPGCWSASRSSRRRCSGHSARPSAPGPYPGLLHSPPSAGRKQQISQHCWKHLVETQGSVISGTKHSNNSGPEYQRGGCDLLHYC